MPTLAFRKEYWRRPIWFGLWALYGDFDIDEIYEGASADLDLTTSGPPPRPEHLACPLAATHPELTRSRLSLAALGAGNWLNGTAVALLWLYLLLTTIFLVNLMIAQVELRAPEGHGQRRRPCPLCLRALPPRGGAASPFEAATGKGR